MTPSPRSGMRAGILLFSIGILFFAVSDALGKWLVADYSVGELLLVRTGGAALVLVPLLWWHRADLRVPDQWGLHAVRVLCMAADTYCFYFATKALPLADVMTFYLAAPLIITALAVPVLGERVGLARGGAVVLGFVGVVVALRPGSEALSPSALIALAGATLFALTVTITRKLRDTHWLTLVALQFAGAGVVGAVGGGLDWVRPSPADVGLMALVGIVSMACFICITKALNLAPASVLGPFQYASILWAALLGWAIWGDVPAANVLLGAGIIVASGIALIYG